MKWLLTLHFNVGLKFFRGSQMEFRFNPYQDFQLKAIEGISDLFEGQVPIQANLRFGGMYTPFAAVANRVDLDETILLHNLQKVQGRNFIRKDEELKVIEEKIQTPHGETTIKFPNFSIEMETGTGKTYVYLRTIFELYSRYGMRKFIIVVPSIAIREGTLKTLQLTKKHFQELYGNPIYRFYRYDSSNLSQVRQFALSDGIEIMIMTLDSFNKATNVIRQSTDRLQGETPLFLIQASRPILILDEPQNMESEKAIAALSTLHPLFALRYSATHRNPYNIVYRLTPADAYQQGLVKKIEIDSVIRENEENQPYIRIESIQTKKNTVTATLIVHKLMKSGQVKETAITVRPGDNLELKTNRSEYSSYLIDEINPGLRFVRFGNNIELKLGEEIGSDREVIFQVQIWHAIEEHMRKQARLRDKNIKVLSLFFIDRVANYTDENGIIRKIFDQAFDQIKLHYREWEKLKPEEVRAAYFAEKKRRSGETELLDSISGESKEDEAAYDLIMRDKEILLSFPQEDDEDSLQRKKRVSFIFSHSALREGWDNPNIFQICTLNQTASNIKKRQEVGRGIRLSVDQAGNRVHDESINILTVIANESYRQYVEKYQSEIASDYQIEIESRYGKPINQLSEEERRKIEDEYGEGILPPPPRKAREQRSRLRKARVLSDEFKDLWERIKYKTRYSVKIDTEKLLNDVVSTMENCQISPPRVAITKAQIITGDDGIFEAMQTSASKTAATLEGRWPLPNIVDLMADLMDHTSPPVRLTRKTLLEIFRRTPNKQMVMDNPHEWATIAIRILKEKLADHLVDGIQYTQVTNIAGQEDIPIQEKWYEMRQILDDEEIELFSKYIESTHPEKSVYDLVPCDSDIERQFVKDLEMRQDVKLYLKLPYWFTVPTPVGEYRPDWAIVMDNPENGSKPVLYLVTETKGSLSHSHLRPEEWRKIQCGAAHFGSKQFNKQGALEDVDFKAITTANEIP